MAALPALESALGAGAEDAVDRHPERALKRAHSAASTRGRGGGSAAVAGALAPRSRRALRP
jgi:hypothetical protein